MRGPAFQKFITFAVLLPESFRGGCSFGLRLRRRPTGRPRRRQTSPARDRLRTARARLTAGGCVGIHCRCGRLRVNSGTGATPAHGRGASIRYKSMGHHGHSAAVYRQRAAAREPGFPAVDDTPRQPPGESPARHSWRAQRQPGANVPSAPAGRAPFPVHTSAGTGVRCGRIAIRGSKRRPFAQSPPREIKPGDGLKSAAAFPFDRLRRLYMRCGTSIPSRSSNFVITPSVRTQSPRRAPRSSASFSERM